MSSEINNNAEESSYRFLVVDDDKTFLQFTSTFFKEAGFEVVTSTSAEHALELLESTFIDVIFCDYKLTESSSSMPGIDGLEFLKRIKPRYKDIPFIMITGFGTVEAAVDAMKGGAFDFITKPVERDNLLLVAQRAIQHIQLTRELNALRSEVSAKYEFKEIIGQSPNMKRLFDIMRQVAKSDATILIQGESGTGKELVARAIHYNSVRNRQPFLAVNCSAIPETLLEGELFGYVKGAFTGAVRSRKGYFWEAQGGTVFLDEIGDVSIPLQTKLLRVLQEREIRPIGGEEHDVRKIDVRIIAATNQSLKNMIAENKFRDDLYYRLAVITLEIPSLKERKTDIPLIAAHFINEYSKRTNITQKSLNPEALEALMSYNWPGNVRQLENALERAIVLGQSESIEVEDFPEEILDELYSNTMAKKSANFHGTLKEIVNRQTAVIEKDAILHALKESNNNKLLAAKKLSISRASLYNKIKQHNISLDE